MRRNGSTRGNDVIRTCLLTCLPVGSLFAPPISAQTADAYRKRATELAHAKSWDDAIANYRKALGTGAQRRGHALQPSLSAEVQRENPEKP